MRKPSQSVFAAWTYILNQGFQPDPSCSASLGSLMGIQMQKTLKESADPLRVH